MNTRTIARGLATLTVTAGLGLAGSVAVDAASLPSPTPTNSASPALLSGVKSLCNIGVQRRLAVLSADDTFVETSVGADRQRPVDARGTDQR